MPDIEFPVTLNDIKFEETESYHAQGVGAKCGDMVAVRPCDEKFENKTFLGIYIGDVPLSQSASIKDDVLTISRGLYNPMIFIPDQNEVVFGCGSWWGRIKSEQHLKQITDEDINNVWYVKALKQLENS